VTRLHVTCTEGEPGAARVVLVHGSMDRSTSFARLQRELEGLTVVRYDRRGYGRSVDAGPATSFDQQVEDLAGVVGTTPSVVVGHSYGGVIAAALAQRRPDLVLALVAYEAPMPWQPWWPATSAGGTAMRIADDPGDAAEAFMRRMVGDARWERLPPSTRAARRAEGPALIAELAHLRGIEDPPYDPAHIEVPVVAGSGSDTAEHHRRAPRELAAAAPRGEHHEVDGCGHGVHLTHPAALATMVRRAIQMAT
jgi:pimeloyl-ACP methyl ester carboxylesterase